MLFAILWHIFWLSVIIFSVWVFLYGIAMVLIICRERGTVLYYVRRFLRESTIIESAEKCLGMDESSGR